VYIANREEYAMSKLISAILFAFALVIPAPAQNQQSAPPSFTGFLKNMYRNNSREISRSAEKFPEESYGLRPGPQTEVRTFGQLVGHLANFNYLSPELQKDDKGESRLEAGATKCPTAARVFISKVALSRSAVSVGYI
jgi:hypothetical protein